MADPACDSRDLIVISSPKKNRHGLSSTSSTRTECSLVESGLRLPHIGGERVLLVERNSHERLLSAENYVGSVVGCLMFVDAVAQPRQVNPGKHGFTLPEHNR